MPNPELTVLIPAHNEAALVGRCIDSVKEDLAIHSPDLSAEIIVIASRSTDSTELVAGDHLYKGHEINGQVIRTRKRGKKVALNAGLDIANGEHVLCVDADTLVVPGAISKAVHALREDGARLASTQYKPFMRESWLNKRPAPSIELLKFCGRVARAPHHQAIGRFMAFARMDLPEGFHEGVAPDDTWVSAYISQRFGLNSIHVSNETGSIYCPPLTIADLKMQIARYASAQLLVVSEHPDLAGYFDDLRAHWARVDDDTAQQRWVLEAEAHGLEFDKWMTRYETISTGARQLRRATCAVLRSARTDFWQPQQSTKTTPVLLTATA